MGFLDKVKAGAQEATQKVKESAGDVQTKREIGKVYDELGKKAFELQKYGVISHPELAEMVAKIEALTEKLEADDDEAAPAAAAPDAPAPAEPAPANEAHHTPPPPPAPPA